MSRRKNRIFEEVNIIDIAHKGKAIGRDSSGEIVLVSDCVPGDKIKGIGIKKKKGVWQVVPESITEKSPWRKEPDCPHFPVCGGCKWQNLTLEKQLFFKQQQLEQTIKRIAGIDDIEFLPIIPSPKSYEFRNKLEFSFSNREWLTAEQIKSSDVIEKKSALGFHPAGRFEKVVNITTCKLMEDEVNIMRNFIKERSIELGLSFYDSFKQSGDLRNIVFRSNRKNEFMVNLVLGIDKNEIVDKLLNEFSDKFPKVVALFYMTNKKLNDSTYDIEAKHVAGKEYLNENIGDLNFKVGPKSFFQTNIFQTEQLYAQLKSWADLKGEEIVYDLYSGIGSIALYIADSCKQIIAVEDVKEAVEDAKLNAELNNVAHVQYLTGKVETLINEAKLDQLPQPDVIITDPPRTGMHKDVVNFILQLAPEKIVYVSCEPSTQARDIALLKEQYKLTKIQAYDMFPQTSHIESLALLVKRK